MKKGVRSSNPRQHARARELRNEASISERVLWEWLRKDRRGARFHRQVPVGPYILDFYCPAASLCVEVDGEQHAESTDRDRRRDLFLLERGIVTLRIPSLDLFAVHEIGAIDWIARIEHLVVSRKSHAADSLPQPLPHLQANEGEEQKPPPRQLADEEGVRGGVRPGATCAETAAQPLPT